MLSKLAIARTAAKVTPLRVFAAANQGSILAFHTAIPVRAKEESKDAAAPAIDKCNPLYSPDSWDQWTNVGYTNLAPIGHRFWADLPAPYKYYGVKVDPKDVENPGFVWKLFTDWRTAVPISGVLAMPLFLYDIFAFDERWMLAAIFWMTIGIIRTQVGPSLGSAITQGIEDENREVYEVDAEYRKALYSLAPVHTALLNLESDLKAKHAAERDLKRVEASAATREVKIAQTAKMVAMLDYMVLLDREAEQTAQTRVRKQAFDSITQAVRSDAALQQKSIDDALAALADEIPAEKMTVVNLYQNKLRQLVDETCEAGPSEAEQATARDMFAKKFGFIEEVTAVALETAKHDPKEWAVLVAKVGGQAPKVGMKTVDTMPIDC